MMKNFVFSLVVFFIIYLFYLFFVILRKNKLEKFKKNAYISLLVNRYNVDINSINFKLLVHVIALTNAFIVSSSFFIMQLFKNIYIGFVIAIISLIILEIFMYKLIGFLYRKKEK